MAVRFLLVALFLTLPSAAMAQAGMQDGSNEPSPFTYQPRDGKSEKTAFGLSLGLTLGIAGLGAGVAIAGVAVGQHGDGTVAIVGFSILALGLIVGPSIGHFYVGDTSTAIERMLARTLGLGLTAGLCVLALGLYISVGVSETNGNERPTWPAYLSLAGAVLSLLGVIVFDGFDIWDAPHAAARANLGPRVSVAPMVARIGNSTAVGLGVGSAF